MPSPAQIAKNRIVFLFKKDPLKAIFSVLDVIQKAGDEAKDAMIEKARKDFESHIAKMEASHKGMMNELMANLKLQLEAKMQALPMLKGESIVGPKGARGSIFLGTFNKFSDLPSPESYQQGDYAIVGEQGTIWYIV